MIEATLLVIALIVATIAVVNWTVRIRDSHVAAAHYTREFVALMQELLQDPLIPNSSKNMLMAMAPYIGDAKLARWASRDMKLERRPVKGRTWETLDKLEDPERKQRVYWAILLFATALSYRDRGDGWRLRAMVMGHSPREIETPAVEMVHEIRSRDHVPATAGAC